jgi:hypothetical protein
MAKLIYVTNVSLDGYIEDERGAFDWFPIDDEVFAFTTDLLRSVGTFLYGRRLYEAMAVWETDAALAAQSDLMADFASAWQVASKVVYSTDPRRGVNCRHPTRTPFRPRRSTRTEGHGQQRSHRRRCQPRDAGFQGRAGRRVPAVHPAHCRRRGKPGLPTGMRADLEFLDERRFRNGVVHLRYRPLGQ